MTEDGPAGCCEHHGEALTEHLPSKGERPMNKSTNQHTQPETECPIWCDVPSPHTGEHDGSADLPKVTATGNREDFRSYDDGLVVPEVGTRLIQHDEPSNTVPPLRIAITVIRASAMESACCQLTLDEAALLRKHLTALLRDAGMEVAW